MEIIDSPSRIDVLLKELSKSRVGISIKLPHDRQSYTSTILDVDTSARTFALDELIPTGGNLKLKLFGQFQAEGLIRKVSARFSTTVLETLAHTGASYYSAAIPQRIEYHQQRRNYRVYINLSNPVEILLHSASTGQVSGRVLDLSLRGASFITREEIAAKPGDIFSRCALSLPNGGPLICRASVRYSRFNVKFGGWRVGLEFIGLQAEQKKALRACVMKIERMALRIRPEA